MVKVGVTFKMTGCEEQQLQSFGLRFSPKVDLGQGLESK